MAVLRGTLPVLGCGVISMCVAVCYIYHRQVLLVYRALRHIQTEVYFCG